MIRLVLSVQHRVLLRCVFFGIGLIAILISTATSCGLLIGIEVLLEIFINKYNKYKEQYEKDQQTIKSFGSLYRNS